MIGRVNGLNSAGGPGVDERIGALPDEDAVAGLKVRRSYATQDPPGGDAG